MIANDTCAAVRPSGVKQNNENRDSGRGSFENVRSRGWLKCNVMLGTVSLLNMVILSTR